MHANNIANNDVTVEKHQNYMWTRKQKKKEEGGVGRNGHDKHRANSKLKINDERKSS